MWKIFMIFIKGKFGFNNMFVAKFINQWSNFPKLGCHLTKVSTILIQIALIFPQTLYTVAAIILIRSRDTEGPTISGKPGKSYENLGIQENLE